jgi:hypothetical protein
MKFIESVKNDGYIQTEGQKGNPWSVLLFLKVRKAGVTGGGRKLHNEELHNLHSSSSIIRIIMSRRMRWAGHVALMGRRERV